MSVFVVNNLNSARLGEISVLNDSIELCAVKVEVSPRCSLSVLGIYRPPNSDLSEFNRKLFNEILGALDLLIKFWWAVI